MRIGITGSWKQADVKSWHLLSDLKHFQDASHQIGIAIAQSGAEITVGSDSDFTADKFAVEGYLSNYSDTLKVRVIRPLNRSQPFQDLYDRYPKAFIYLTGASSTWRHTRQNFISDIDALVTVGGADGTLQAGLELRLTRKRLIPIGSFGGASSRMLTEILKSGTLRNVEDFERLSNPWAKDMASHVVTVLGANKPSAVLLIHGHAKDWIELQSWLQHQKLANPFVMGQEFTAGQTLPEKFEQMANEADAAIALATPDDLASTASHTDVIRQRARQNVWVETGWFWGRLGRSRIMLLVRGDVEIPSDLDGIEFCKYNKSVLEAEPEIQKFLLQVSKKNQ